jgi:competence protein ComEC
LIKACLLVLAGGFAAQHNRLQLDSDHCKMLFVAVVLIFACRHLRYFAFLLLGFTLFVQAGNEILDSRLESRFAGDSMLARVRVADFPKITGSSISMLVESAGDPRIPDRSHVTWYDPSKLPAMGDIWEFELRLRRPRGNSNPGVFSRENWMFRQRLHASGYVVPGHRNRLIETGSLSPIESYRRDFVGEAEANGGQSASILAAIGVGARHLISREQWDRFAKTGTSHLMAISGLHIGLAAAASFGVFVLLSGVLRLRGNNLDFAVIASVITSSAYAIISGFVVPSQRATAMLGLGGFAFLCRRRAEPARIVALVALLVFILDPVSLMTPGFCLSFGAVVLLLWFSKGFWRTVVALRLRKVIGMQLVLLLGLMPLTVLTFHRIALSAPVVNLLTVPVFSMVTVPLTLLSMVVRPFQDAAADSLLSLGARSIRLIEWLVGIFAELPIADITVAGVDGADTAIWCIVFLPAIWVLLPRGWPGRWIAVLGVVALLLYKPARPPHLCVDTHVLDVGQGLAVVLQSRQYTVLFDTGRSYRGGGSAAEQVILPFLHHQGIQSIDTLVVSHADDDHAGGVLALIGQFDVARIRAGETIPVPGRTVIECKAGEFWQSDGISYRFIHPDAGSALEGNDASCVLTVSAGSHHLVLTGDIEGEAELEVLHRYPFESASVVLIPHHGSLTSSSPAFVNRLRPGYAIASAAHENRWGFPKERVTRRWEGIGAVVMDTASSGAISFRLCAGEGISSLREERFRQRRFWHD